MFGEIFERTFINILWRFTYVKKRGQLVNIRENSWDLAMIENSSNSNLVQGLLISWYHWANAMKIGGYANEIAHDLQEKVWVVLNGAIDYI